MPETISIPAPKAKARKPKGERAVRGPAPEVQSFIDELGPLPLDAPAGTENAAAFRDYQDTGSEPAERSEDVKKELKRLRRAGVALGVHASWSLVALDENNPGAGARLIFWKTSKKDKATAAADEQNSEALFADVSDEDDSNDE